MAQFLQWGAVLGLLCLITFTSRAEEDGIAPANTVPSFDEALKEYGDGEQINKEAFFKFAKSKLGRQFLFDNMGDDVLEELFEAEDKNHDNAINQKEYQDFIEHITN